MRARPHPGAGVEITDIDVRDLDDATFGDLFELFSEHGLVFIRDQSLDENAHIAFARRLGEININRFFTAHPEHPEIALVVKEPHQRGNIGGAWHTDHSYDVEPALGSVLVARELPTSGGDTHFVSMYDAFESLPSPLRARLRKMRAVHSSKHVFGSRGAILRWLAGNEGRVANPELADALDDVTHPVVIRHPISGREALYVNPGFTLRFEGRSIPTSMPLLGLLYANALRPRHVAKFRWRPGSIAIWDNRATWHFAKNGLPWAATRDASHHPRGLRARGRVARTH